MGPVEEPSRSCVFCASYHSVGNGLICLGRERHSLCNSCFEKFANEGLERAAQSRLKWPVPGCTSEPWPLVKIAQHLPETVFQRILETKERLQQNAMRSQDPLALPSYWSDSLQASQNRRWKVVALRHSTAEWKALANAVSLVPGAGLGGRDMRLQGTHSGFRLGAAWRI